MRITQGSMVDNMMRYLQHNLEKLDSYNTQLSTGKQFQVPSENPIGAATSMKFNSIIQQTEQYVRNIDQGKQWLSNTEGTLDSVQKTLQRGRELIVYGANGSLSQEDKDAIAKEISQLRDEMINLSNTKFGDRYLFSGHKTDTPAFDLDGNFTADNNAIVREISPGITMNINADGEAIFKDAIDTLKAVEENLNTGATATVGNITINEINDAINIMDDRINVNIKNRSTIGAKINRLDLALNRLEEQKLQTVESLSKNEDVDITEAITNLKMQESVYRASLAVNARIMQPSLIEFLR